MFTAAPSEAKKTILSKQVSSPTSVKAFLIASYILLASWEGKSCSDKKATFSWKSVQQTEHKYTLFQLPTNPWSHHIICLWNYFLKKLFLHLFITYKICTRVDKVMTGWFVFIWTSWKEFDIMKFFKFDYVHKIGIWSSPLCYWIGNMKWLFKTFCLGISHWSWFLKTFSDFSRASRSTFGDIFLPNSLAFLFFSNFTASECILVFAWSFTALLWKLVLLFTKLGL